jgi:hypothetical protein
VTTGVSLTVTTTFGEQVQVPSTVAADVAAKRRPLRLFQPASTGGRSEPWLVIVPGAVSPLAGEPVEDVLLTTDEMANLAWAIERRVPGIDGRGADRTEVPGAGHWRLGLGRYPVQRQRLSRAGIRLTRRAERVRTSDGRTVVWMERRSETGRGEGHQRAAL